ncbi:MEDS domain-containing protein [Clostridium tyrobutyricum]|uniref:MEDS domain-containing protein n=1 Tax=Clostridium tyrobutyricum TaxID=1519 RepID=UPI001C3D31AC|nr:MEDS domain-containing protein [Clostridium tyrobutyricum]MBV4436842.1 MEDS domain-containing protein [Clostridium tyrobutyricum]
MYDKNIFGVNSAFYYFGLEHFYVNIYNYIKNGIRKNEIVWLCVNNDVYKNIKSYIGAYENWYHNICNFPKILNLYKYYGVSSIRNKLIEYENGIIEKGYNGIRFIIDVKHIISISSKEDFLKFDSDMLDIIYKTRSSVMCAYDFENYVNTRDIIDDKIIEESSATHFSRLYKGELQNCQKLLNI